MNKSEENYISKILIVDDMPANVDVLVNILEPEGYKIVFAGTGEKAVKIAPRAMPDIILMDVMMPGIDGFEACQQLKNIEATQHIPVIFITAKRDSQDISDGFAAGGVDYISKPVHALEVKARVKTHIALHLHEVQLKRLIQERTQELETSLENLIKMQTHLVESEKMVSLGHLVAGVAHELNTPLGICVTADSHLHHEARTINQVFTEGSLRKQDLVEFINTTTQVTEIMLSNLERASSLIRNFKQVAVDVSSDMVRSFNLTDYLKQILQSLQPELKHTALQIEIEGDQALVIQHDPGAFSQIITNLVMNSLTHAYDAEDHGCILIQAHAKGATVHLSYCDDGKGMTPETLQKVFEPFYTTRRGSGGSGLGMSIVYNLVTHQLNGQVTCTSEVGKGATFHMAFPLVVADSAS